MQRGLARAVAKLGTARRRGARRRSRARAGEARVILAYDLLLVPLAILLAPLLALAALASARSARSARCSSACARCRACPSARCGCTQRAWARSRPRRRSSRALVDQGVPVIATATTVTGRARLRARLPRVRSRLAPLDLPGLVQLSLARARVAVLVLIETELWPNLLAAAASRGTRVVDRRRPDLGPQLPALPRALAVLRAAARAPAPRRRARRARPRALRRDRRAATSARRWSAT